MLNPSEEEELKWLHYILKYCDAQINLIELAKQAESKQEFLLYLEAMDTNVLQLPKEAQSNLKALDCVVCGIGDLAQLREKALELNVIRRKV